MSCTVAKLNDLFRSTLVTGHVLLTEGVCALPDAVREAIIAKVQNFDNFGPDNDPYGERDFGAFEQDAAGRIFWKIDYYDRTLTMGSEDPADPKRTCRVLTIMLASEY